MSDISPYVFVERFGLELSERVVESVVYAAQYYSQTTGSYYASSREDTVYLPKLRKVIQEYKVLLEYERKYTSRKESWYMSVGKGLKTF